MNFSIPEGLTELLQDFTVEILRKKPDDLVQFGAQYFNTLLKTRQIENTKQLNETQINHSNQASSSSSSSSSSVSSNDDDEIGEIPEIPRKDGRFAGRRHSVAAEKYNPEDDDDTTRIFHAKSDDERKYLLDAIKNIFMFRALDQNQINNLLDAMFSRLAHENEVIIEQGDDGDNFYVIESGTYDIYVNKVKVGAYNDRGSFGELALMYNMPRAATIIATKNGKLWALDRLTFKRIVLKSAFEKRKMYEQLLDNMPLFKGLNAYQRMNIADALYSKTYTINEVIIKQGDEANCMFFMESGIVRILRTQNNETKEIKVCNKGDYFGELALLTKKPRAATAIASSNDVKCAILDVDAFERLLGPCLDIMKNNMNNYEVTLKNLFGDKFNMADLR